MYKVLLYYKYVKIDDPQKLRDLQFEFCFNHNLKGRIIVAKEGINGTVEGLEKDTNAYIEMMKADPRFSDIHWKISDGNGECFPRLSVKVRSEIVSANLGEDDFDPNELTGKRLSADELQKWFEEGRDFAIVDMRNDYEFDIGHFEKSINIEMKNFRDLSQKISELEDLKDKTVVTFCTGGVRCEKASGYLLKKGFKDVYQLDGGIVAYLEKYPNQYFKGTMYVFDGRQAMAYSDDYSPITNCSLCKKSCDRYLNCGNVLCNKKWIACEDCVKVDRTENCVKCREESKVLA